MNIVEKARTFAIAAHSAIGQVRKYTSEPYCIHLEEVANIVRSTYHTEEMVAAAWLHDVVEDTKVSLDLIRQEFGDEIADLVFWLTDVSKPEDGKRSERKAIDRAHLANASAAAHTVKLADVISNVESIAKYDPDFARVYLVEKTLLLEVLSRGDKALMAQAHKLIEESSKLLS